MAYSKSLNPVNGTGSQTISALKEQVRIVRYGSLSHTHTDSITTDDSGNISTTFEIHSGVATSVYMDFTTGTTYSPQNGVTISITANGVDQANLQSTQMGELGGVIMTASNGVITIHRLAMETTAPNIDFINPILEDFSGFGDVRVEVQLTYNPESVGQVFSMTSNYN